MNAVVFAYHNMGILGLEALVRHAVLPVLVVTHQDDPDENRWYGSVSKWCTDHDIDCIEVSDVNDPDMAEQVRSLAPDFIFSFYCREILSSQLLNIPKAGALNLHGSLLPRYRGCAPVNWVLVNGEQETGVTLHYMVEQADAGDIVGQEPVPIAPDDTALSLYRKIEDAARVLLDRTLPSVLDGSAERFPQDISAGSYFGRRTPEDGLIDWDSGAVDICNLVRAVTCPYPGAFCDFTGRRTVIWKAAVTDESALKPGEILVKASEVLVGTADNAVRLLAVESEGKLFEGAQIADFAKSIGDSPHPPHKELL